ncbi:flagellar hook-length control protein FliK [Paenibacillus sp. IHB B 3415]|uniref:flagellar hook-length control protein FliK n=1 Tax=Paenibacillus sp. IHB B 3415 TaxID=867080 RepID=UPI00069ADEFB|nr:flagellar hook-length control protein FliK [Paenibacillus sp. IHB B 3415]
MSLIVQTLSAGNLAAAGGTSTGTSGTASTATPFAQTLVQSMGGTTAKGTEAPVLGNLASLLQGLLNAVQTKGEESASTDAKKAELLEGLTQDMENLDASLEADPALLAALQGWILQVSALLSGNTPAEQTDASDTGAVASTGLSPLAQNPETLRFAVQDELNSLVQLVQDAAVSGSEETATKGAALLNQFSAILAESVPADNKPKLKTVSTTEASSASLKQASGTETKQNVEDSRRLVSNIRTFLDSAAVKTEAAPVSKAVNGTTVTAEESPQLLSTGIASVKETATAEEALPAVKTSAGEPEIVTLGQLSLSNGISAPLKAPTSPVPVQQFAQEMNTFISGKLEIVKKGGVAEATITLFPENLGQVDVKISMQNGNLVAQFLTQHSGTKDILEQQMNQLRLALQSQGLQVERLEVTQNNPSAQSQWTGQQGQQTGAGGQQQGRRSRERQEESADAVLAAELNGEWKDWVSATQQDNNQNGSFSAKV